jgi:hypothetical protein
MRPRRRRLPPRRAVHKVAASRDAWGVGVTDPHPLDQLRAFLLDQVIPRLRVLVAQDDSGIVGFSAATEDSVGQLDVPVGRIGRGIGFVLLHLAQEQSSG